MTVTTRIYYSTDSSAPVLSGTTGSLITLLDAVLVNGYGSRQAAGWTKPYSDAGAYKAVFRQGGGNQKYLRVLDDGITINVRHANVRYYYDMSDVNTGTGETPSSSVANNFHKSFTADSVVRPWVIIATDRSFYFFVNLDSATKTCIFFFGDISENIYDRFNLTIICASNYNSTNSISGSYSQLTELTSSASADGVNHGYLYDHFYRSAISLKKFGNYNYSKSAVCFGGAGQPYPNPADSKLHMGRIYIQTDNHGVLGILPGLWNPYHLRPLTHGDTFSALDKQFIVLDCENNLGQCFIELSNTWY
jgi:hypothetical protein